MARPKTEPKGAGGLNDRQRRFCVEYLIDMNATQAAIRAGYSPRSAPATSSRLLAKGKVSEEINRLKAELFEDRERQVQEIERRMLRIALGDLREVCEMRDGELAVKALDEMGDAAVLVEDLQVSRESDGEGQSSTRVKLRMADRLAAAKFLHGILSPQVQRVEVSGLSEAAANFVVSAGVQHSDCTDPEQVAELRRGAQALLGEE